MFVVRKYLAYLVFDNDKEEKEQGFVYAFEPFSNKVVPAVFEAHETVCRPYRSALDRAKELNKAPKKEEVNDLCY